jgi:PhnB protein
MNKTTFTKDIENATLTIERVFPAERSRVWQAMTDAKILDQWWAPSPWKTETVHMEFRVGGSWHYAMNGPEGERHFGRMDYLEIVAGQRFKSSDVFCDANGNADESLPHQQMNFSLVEQGSDTKVVSVVQYATAEDMETILKMGMQEGLTMAQDQLEQLLLAG